MRRIGQLSLLCLAGLFLVMPVWGQEESKEDPKIRAKFLASPFLQAKMIKLNFDKETKTYTFTVQVPDQKKTPNAEGQKKYAELYRAYSNAYRARDVNQMKQLYDQVVAAQQAAFDIIETPYNFDLKSDEKVRIRFLNPPPREDDNGKAKPYSPQELAKLKGPDATLPGYEAKFENLDVEKQVRVYLEKAKAAPPKAKDAPAEPVVYTVTTIIILPKPDEVTAGKTAPPVGVNPFIVK